jgi:SAM-dependent methyltransferase
MNDIRKITQANRLAWNEAMPHHQKANGSTWDKRFIDPNYLALKNNEKDLLLEYGVKNKQVAHLCCNNGAELISIKRLGASRCLGFDISDEAVKEAQDRSDRLGLQCQFIQSDVYDIPETYYGQFDLIYISIGCLGWMPDLNRFFEIASSLLTEDGLIFIHEMHPFAEMLPMDGSDGAPLTLVDPYFKDDPYIETDGIDYVGKTSYQSLPLYWFVWKLSDIINGLAQAGFRIQQFEEYPTDISSLHQVVEQADLAVPLSYIMIAGKP